MHPPEEHSEYRNQVQANRKQKNFLSVKSSGEYLEVFEITIDRPDKLFSVTFGEDTVIEYYQGSAIIDCTDKSACSLAKLDHRFRNRVREKDSPLIRSILLVMA
jgi:hypothetical protein